MNHSRTAAPVFFLALLTICAWFGVVLQFITNVPVWISEGRTTGEALVKFFSYFTILTNLLIAITASFALLLPQTDAGRFCAKPDTITAITVYIIIVGLVYNLVLRPLYHPVAWGKVADETVHSVVPLLYVVYWLLFATKGSVQWGSAFRWLMYPLLYLIYTFIHGWVTGYYPYPFMEVQHIGYTGFWLNSFYLLLVFVCMNLLLISIDKRMGRKKAV